LHNNDLAVISVYYESVDYASGPLPVRQGRAKRASWRNFGHKAGIEHGRVRHLH
jgi:hypothetical protein